MKTRIFVAPKIKVGFQNREGTYTGKLAYIIYFDEKGKLRKEASWQSWRDHKIDPIEFDNVPTDGFTINKDIKRYGGNWFDSKRTMIRIHDPRGFEFEVTTENLIGILMHTDCLRRGLIGEFVYAWAGTELVLLPTSSEEYQNAVKYTKGLSKKVSAKDLVPGISYSTKREGNVLYIGRFNWYQYGGTWEFAGPRKEKKVHVFTNDDGKTFFYKTSMEFLSEANNTTPVDNLADLISKFNKKLYANKIVEYRFVRAKFDPTMEKSRNSYYGPDLKRKVYFAKRPDEMYDETHITLAKKYSEAEKKQIPIGYEVTPASESYYSNLYAIDPSTGKIVSFEGGRCGRSYWHGYYSNRRDTPPKDTNYCESLMLYDLIIVFENGKEKKIEKISELGEE